MTNFLYDLLTIDFETRSEADIKATGSWRYSEDPSTEVMCLALKPKGESPVIWYPTPFREKANLKIGDKVGGFEVIDRHRVVDMINGAKEIEAHNLFFEVGVWINVMEARLNFPPLPIERCRCSMAKAAAHALPRGLDNLSKALHTGIPKDMAGNRLMRSMCSPRKPTKAEQEAK